MGTFCLDYRRSLLTVYRRVLRVFFLFLLLRRVFLRLPPTLTFELFELFALGLFFATFADAFAIGGAFTFRAFIDPFVDGLDAFAGFCVDPEAPIFYIIHRFYSVTLVTCITPMIPCYPPIVDALPVVRSLSPSSIPMGHLEKRLVKDNQCQQKNDKNNRNG